MEVVTIEPHGFCCGVSSAIARVAAALGDSPVYAMHPLVHNDAVMREVCGRGLRMVRTPDEIPAGAVLLFSAHGVSPGLRRTAAARGFRILDTTCPFVARSHRTILELASRGAAVAIVGDPAHVEVRGLVGEAGDAGARFAVVGSAGDVGRLDFPEDAEVGVVVQTTLDSRRLDAVLAALRGRYPKLSALPASAVCTATRERQDAVRGFVAGSLARKPSARVGVVVVGSPASGNTRRLAECAGDAGAAFVARVTDRAEAAELAMPPLDVLGITAGASTPEPELAAVRSLWT